MAYYPVFDKQDGHFIAEFTDYQEACIFARKNGGYVGYRHY